MSPASGDGHFFNLVRCPGQINNKVSIQLMSPASGDGLGWQLVGADSQLLVSIQLMSPASGD